MLLVFCCFCSSTISSTSVSVLTVDLLSSADVCDGSLDSSSSFVDRIVLSCDDAELHEDENIHDIADGGCSFGFSSSSAERIVLSLVEAECNHVGSDRIGSFMASLSTMSAPAARSFS